eukprot:16442609-Heterocapsa_arctica.AAC.1
MAACSAAGAGASSLRGAATPQRLPAICRYVSKLFRLCRVALDVCGRPASTGSKLRRFLFTART